MAADQADGTRVSMNMKSYPGKLDNLAQSNVMAVGVMDFIVC